MLRFGASVAARTGRTVLAGLDGLVIGLVLTYAAFTALGAPALYLGLPPGLAILLIGSSVAVVCAAGAFAAVALRFAILRVGRGLGHITHLDRVRWLVAPAAFASRALHAMPLPWLGAFAVLLWIAMVGFETAPLGVLRPPAMTTPYVYAGGLVGALLGMARASTGAPGAPAGVVGRTIAATCVGLLAIVVVGSSAVATDPGTSTGLVANDPAFVGDRPTDLLPDPGAVGPYAVETLSYGTGHDARRPAFGADVDVVTEPVDATTLLSPLTGGVDGVRRWFFGFGTDALPIQGLVWLPVGDGPFPLVLMVHGNHAMGDFSEDGYAYLGRHLASRGSIAVSVDEDFLNGSWVGEWHGGEQLVRAWLLLLHLDQWRTWRAEHPGERHGTADLAKVALIGHSRGGEAAAVAAAIAVNERPPRSAMTPWPVGLHVDAVVSIAPSDGQYTGALTLDGVDFLTLAGGHDSDARAWSGIRQYARTRLDDTGFKAAVWAYRANHGQFNTVWGRSDFGPFGGALLNLEPLMSATEQEDLAKTSIGAFVEASLHGQVGYRAFFRRPMLGASWLPDDIVLVRSWEGAAKPLLLPNGREVAGVTATWRGLELERRAMPLRALQPDQAMIGTSLEWSVGDGVARWEIAGLRALGPHTADSSLRFALADDRALTDGQLEPLEITVFARTTDGREVAVPLSTYGALPPPLPVRLVKADVLAQVAGIDLTLRSPVERVLQSYAIPLGDLAAADPGFEVADLAAFGIEVSRSTGGGLWLADVGLGAPATVRDPVAASAP